LAKDDIINWNDLIEADNEEMTSRSSPKISVLIFSYNFERYLEECINSVIHQTLRPFEIIICDDHSTDDSWSIISRFHREHPGVIQAYRQESNVGPARNANFGRRIAKGDLLSWIDGDDLWLPKKLELEWKALQRNPGADIAYSNVYTIDANGRRMGIWYDGKGDCPPSGNVFSQVFSRRIFPNFISTFRNELVRRRALDQEGYCDENLQNHWDWDMKIRYASRFQVEYSGEPLVLYRKHTGGIHHTLAHFRVKSLMTVYKKNLPLLDVLSSEEAQKVRARVESFLALTEARDSFSEKRFIRAAGKAIHSLFLDPRNQWRDFLRLFRSRILRLNHSKTSRTVE